jgi:hypothetical protein
MPMQLNEYRAKLIDKILFARSQEEVKRYIDTALKALTQNNVNGHIIARFIEKILSELESFNPMNKDAQQWSNIKMAIILFTRLKTEYNAPA